MKVRLISQQSSVLWQNHELRFRHCIHKNKPDLDQNKDNIQEVASKQVVEGMRGQVFQITFAGRSQKRSLYDMPTKISLRLSAEEKDS